MNATEHPEYIAEDNHLRRVTDAVRQLVARMEQRHASATRRDREDVLWDLRHDFAAATSPERERERIGTYIHALNEPYFLRLDVQVGEETVRQRVYIGKSGLRLGKDLSVVDWRAPIAVLRHARTGFLTYFAPEGPQQAEIFLHRVFNITDCSLVEIIDLLDRRATDRDGSAHEVIKTIVDPDVFLQRALEGHIGQKMREIVETIQKDQEDLIRLPIERPVVIQGAAGTGKTVVSLHRLAYLLFPEHEHNLSPSSVLVIAPTKLFIDYVSEVLPDLNIDHIRMQTFEDWALQRLLGANSRNAAKASWAMPMSSPVQRIKRSLVWLSLASH